MDKIKLEIPGNPQYNQMLRLTCASLANRVGFDIDKVADLQQVVSEIFTFLITNNEFINVIFNICDDSIKVEFDDIKRIGEEGLNDAVFEIKKQIISYLSDELLLEERKITVILNKG